MTMDRQSGINDFTHTLTDIIDIVWRNRPVKAEVYIIAVGYWDVNDDSTVWP